MACPGKRGSQHTASAAYTDHPDGQARCTYQVGMSICDVRVHVSSVGAVDARYRVLVNATVEPARQALAARYPNEVFYTEASEPLRQHFRTSSHIGGPLVDTMIRLLIDTDHRLDHPDVLDFLDVGAGDGDLLVSTARTLARRLPALAARVRWRGLDIREQPAGLPNDIEWIVGDVRSCLPAEITGVVTAFELLDDVEPVTVSATAQVGVASEVCRNLDAGVALFVDYDQRVIGTQLAGYRHGRQLDPALPISMNRTRAVDFAALQAALSGFGEVELGTQAATLDAREPAGLSTLARLTWRSDLAELTARPGLGEHSWLHVRRKDGW